MYCSFNCWCPCLDSFSYPPKALSHLHLKRPNQFILLDSLQLEDSHLLRQVKLK